MEPHPSAELTPTRGDLTQRRSSYEPPERRQLPPRTTCLALVLTVVGFACFIGAIIALALDHGGAIPLLMLAVLTLLPGGYASFHLYGIYRRWPGYYDNFSNLNDLELV